jgi:hypothetical protein
VDLGDVRWIEREGPSVAGREERDELAAPLVEHLRFPYLLQVRATNTKFFPESAPCCMRVVFTGRDIGCK